MKPISAAIILFISAVASISAAGEVSSKEPILVWAARNNLTEITRKLLDNGVDVNQRDLMGNTPLHMAVKYPELVKLLLDRGAMVNAKNLLGETALHLAVRYREVVEILLSRGADKRLKNAFGRTVFDYCMDEGAGSYNQSVMELLIDK